MTFHDALTTLVSLAAAAEAAGQPIDGDALHACVRYLAGMPDLTSALHALDRTPEGGLTAQWDPQFLSLSFVTRWDPPPVGVSP